MLVDTNKSVISLICFLIFRFLQPLFSYRRISYENECLLKKFDNGTGLTRTSIIQKRTRQIFTTHKHRKIFSFFSASFRIFSSSMFRDYSACYCFLQNQICAPRTLNITVYAVSIWHFEVHIHIDFICQLERLIQLFMKFRMSVL